MLLHNSALIFESGYVPRNPSQLTVKMLVRIQVSNGGESGGGGGGRGPDAASVAIAP